MEVGMAAAEGDVVAAGGCKWLPVEQPVGQPGRSIGWPTASVAAAATISTLAMVALALPWPSVGGLGEASA